MNILREVIKDVFNDGKLKKGIISKELENYLTDVWAGFNAAYELDGFHKLKLNKSKDNNLEIIFEFYAFHEERESIFYIAEIYWLEYMGYKEPGYDVRKE